MFWTCTRIWRCVCVCSKNLFECVVHVCTLWPGRNITWVSGSCLTFWMKKSRAGGVRKGWGRGKATVGILARPLRPQGGTPAWLPLFALFFFLSVYLCFSRPAFLWSLPFCLLFFFQQCRLLLLNASAVVTTLAGGCNVCRLSLSLTVWTQYLRNKDELLRFCGQRPRSLWLIKPTFVIRPKVSFTWHHNTLPVIT